MSAGARAGMQRAVAEPQPTPEAPRPSTRAAPRVQRATLRLSEPHDASEREARHVARKVMAQPAAVVFARERVSLLAARAPANAAPPKPATPPPDQVSPELTAEIRAELGGGQPLSEDTRNFMEPRFKANFAGIRIHTDGRAGSIAARLGASAFTFGRDIFFANGAYRPDDPAGMELLAHELTHTIQQREVVQRGVVQRGVVQRGVVQREVDPAAGSDVVVAERTGPQVQRGIISRALDWIADKAYYIPGFRMLTIVIGRNPINMEKVDRSGENILRALIEFIPGGHLIVEALENHGVMKKGGKFIEEQFAALGDLGAAIRDALMEFIDSLGWRDIFHLGDLWDRAKRIFTTPVDKAIDFGKNLVTGIAKLVKEAIIKPLGRWAANNIPKWNLLVGVFGKNPVSDEQESPASALIGSFMELIGQQEIWENIKKGNAVSRAWQWFQTAMKGALALVVSIPGRVIDTLRSLTIFDIVTLVGAFKKIVGAFASFVGDFFKWAGTTVLNLLEIIFSVVAPAVVPYLKKAGSAFSTIIKAPGRFISTLVKAGKQGFNQFKVKFVDYLRDALFKWLLGSSEGASIYFPKSFAPIELLKLGLSVLGLTWQNLRGKLVAATNETVVKALEAGFDIAVKLVKEGPAAAWEELVKNLTNLKQMIVDAAIDFVKGEVVKIAIEKLVSFLTPAGAFIQAIISIYRTIMFIVQKLAEIGRLVAAFIDGLAALANGVVSAAANKVESVLATGLSLAISFLANFAGLGNIPKKVMEIIKKIRAPVDKAMDAVVKWIVDGARKLGKFVAQAGVPHDPQERLRLASQASIAIASRLPKTGLTAPLIAKAHDAIKLRYALTELTPYQQAGAWYVRAVVNPPLVWRLPLPGETAGTGGIAQVATQTGPGGVVTAGVRGELQPGIGRRGMESALATPANLPGLASSYLQGYRRAHLYGPGFGDETAVGLMYASVEVNNQLQSNGRVYGIEGYARQIRDHVARLNGRVGVEVIATSFRDPPPGVPQPLGQPVLREVGYRFAIVNSAGAEVRFRFGQPTASIACAPPRPNGTGGQGKPYVEKLRELLEYLGSRSQRTGL
jgi:hypothetical protein